MDLDAAIHGVSFSLGGERVDPRRVSAACAPCREYQAGEREDVTWPTEHVSPDGGPAPGAVRVHACERTTEPAVGYRLPCPCGCEP